MKKLLMTVVIALAVLALAPAAKADSVSVGPSCATACNGNIVTLNITGNLITLTITTTGTTSNTGNAVAAVEFAIPGLTAANLTEVSAPGGIGAWNLINGPSNAAGCQGSTSTFACSEAAGYDVGGTAYAIVGGVNPLVWTWTINSGTFLAASTTHIGVVWAGVTNGNYSVAPGKNGGGVQAGIISEGLTVPEPGTIALLGCGLLGLAALRRRLL